MSEPLRPLPRTPLALRAPLAATMARGVLLVLALLAASGGCSKSDEGTPEGDAGGATAIALPPPPLAPSAAASNSASARADAASPVDAKAVEARAQAADAGRFCGDKTLGDCPLQLWMKSNATPAIRAGDTGALADVFDAIAQLAPPAGIAPATAYPYWTSIAQDGAAASRMGDVPAAKAACRGCHTQYRPRYHGELRGLPLPRAARPGP